MPEVKPREVDKLEITVLVDNYADIFLADTDIVKRLKILPPTAAKAEPGLSYLIKVTAGGESHTILFDTGISGECLLHNARCLASSAAVVFGELDMKLEDAEAIVLSHGHFDHFGGLLEYLKQNGHSMPMFLHPDAFVKRRMVMGPGFEIDLNSLDGAALEEAGVTFHKGREPQSLASDMILLTGEVKRVTEFEQGVANMEAFINDEWIRDPFLDDQALAIRVKNKGLVVVAGCSHAGIVNTVKHALKITGEDNLHAVLGGFHLGGVNEPLIEPTLAEIKKTEPDYIVPMHCTGWKAINRFSEEMPEQFILNAVGSTYTFQ